MSSERVIVGRLAGVYGVKGWLRLESYTQPLDNVFSYAPWWLCREDEAVEADVVEGRAHGKGFIVKLNGVDDRDAAALMVGREIAVERENLPTLDEGEYYWSDLIGLQVATVDGVALGRVEKMLETGANDVMVVSGDRERLIPYLLERVVRSINLDTGTIVVDWDADF